MIEPLLIIEYRHKNIIEWESLPECAHAHHVSIQLIKELIMTGGSLDGHSTFDIAEHCGMDLAERNGKIVIIRTSPVLTAGFVRCAKRKYSAVHNGSIQEEIAI